MSLEIYPDIIFLLNFSIDSILLFLLKKINRRNSSLKRRLLAAAIGGTVAAVLGIHPWMNMIIRFFILNIGSSILMLYIAFGGMKPAELLKQMIALYLITYFMGGLINSVYYHTNLQLYMIRLENTLIFSTISWKSVIVSFLLIIPVAFMLLYFFRWYQSNTRETLDMELEWHNHSVRTKGLLDSGNCLYDPISRKPVIIIEDTLLSGLLSDEAYRELKKVRDCMLEGAVSSEGRSNEFDQLRYKLIPYQSIGKPKGLMPGLVVDKVVIFKGKETVCNEKVTVAICDNPLSAKKDYHVILHKGLL